VTALAGSIRRIGVRLPRVDVRLVVGIALIGVSILGGLRLSSRADDSVGVFRAAADLPAGHALTGADLEPTRLTAEGVVLDRLQRAESGPPVGRVLRQPLAAGALLTRDALGATAPDGRAVTVPMSADHALGGAIRPGDRVDVLATFDKGTEVSRTITVAAGARVADVLRAEGLFGQDEGALGAVTLVVAPDEVVVVVFAARNGELDVVESAARGARSAFEAVELP